MSICEDEDYIKLMQNAVLKLPELHSYQEY